MRFLIRCFLVNALLLVAALANAAMYRGIQKAGTIPAVPLRKPLAELPHEFGDWVGVDNQTPEKLMYGDDHLDRTYQNRRTGQTLSVWIIFSKTAEDRAHYPERCMEVAGRPEDKASRATCLDGPPHDGSGKHEPVQIYRFGYPGHYQRVFYWHYTMEPDDSDLDDWTRVLRRLRSRPSSVTLQVFAAEPDPEAVPGAIGFVELLDAAFQEFLPPSAVRGNKIAPVYSTDPQRPEDH